MSAFLVLSTLIFIKLCIRTRNLKAKKSVRQACFLCCFQYCQNCPFNIEICISFVFLSCLCAYTSMAEALKQNIFELRDFLRTHKQDFMRSDAMYYTPGYETISMACFNKTLLCYIAEAEVILYETKGERSLSVLEPMRNDIRSQNNSCSPCEAFQETNSTTFWDNFNIFLQKLEDTESHG